MSQKAALTCTKMGCWATTFRTQHPRSWLQLPPEHLSASLLGPLIHLSQGLRLSKVFCHSLVHPLTKHVQRPL